MNGQKKIVPTLRQTRRGNCYPAPPTGVSCLSKAFAARKVLNGAHAVPLAQRQVGGFQHKNGRHAPFVRPSPGYESNERAGSRRIYQNGGALIFQQPDWQQSPIVDTDLVAIYGSATNKRLGENFDFNRYARRTTKLICGTPDAPQFPNALVCGTSDAPQTGGFDRFVVHQMHHTYISHGYGDHLAENRQHLAQHFHHLVQEVHYPRNLFVRIAFGMRSHSGRIFPACGLGNWDVSVTLHFCFKKNHLFASCLVIQIGLPVRIRPGGAHEFANRKSGD